MSGAGEYNQKIYVQRMTVTTDEFGHEDLTYNNAFDTKAKVVYNNGNRETQNEEYFYSQTITFTIHSYCQILDTDRIFYRDEYFRILNVNREKNWKNEIVILTEKINT